MNEQLVTLGSEIKTLRIENGLSQEELSKKAGIDRAQLSKIESGQINGVQYLTIDKIYESLGYLLSPTKDKKTAPHPFVKWAGGKTQLLDVITSYMPKTFNTYYEPFVGGGALFFKLQPKRWVINDINFELYVTYACFRVDEYYKKLIADLEFHQAKHSEEYYYHVRDIVKNKKRLSLKEPEIAARFIYLNKACFNGLYRVNASGFFNVPSGKKKVVHCYDSANFENIKNFLSNTDGVILNDSYEEAVKTAKKGDFVYFDPPYDTWEDKDSFTSYNKDTFGKEQQKELAECYKRLDAKGVYVMLSNHNTKYIQELYKGFNIHVVPAKRMINAKGNGRGAVEEVIITNY